MSLPVKTGLPEGLVIGDTYTIRFDAVDPVTGATVAGVNISKASILSESGAAVSLIQTDFDPVVLTPIGTTLSGSQVGHM